MESERSRRLSLFLRVGYR